MLPRLQISLNSKPVCTAGLEPGVQGVLSAMVEFVQGTPKGDQTDLFIQCNLRDEGDWVWALKNVEAGD